MDPEMKEKILEKFKKFDKDQNGQLDKFEMKAALEEIFLENESEFSYSAIVKLIQSFDENGDEQIDIKEFEKILQKFFINY